MKEGVLSTTTLIFFTEFEKSYTLRILEIATKFDELKTDMQQQKLSLLWSSIPEKKTQSNKFMFFSNSEDALHIVSNFCKKPAKHRANASSIC